MPWEGSHGGGGPAAATTTDQLSGSGQPAVADLSPGPGTGPLPGISIWFHNSSVSGTAPAAPQYGAHGAAAAAQNNAYPRPGWDGGVPRRTGQGQGWAGTSSNTGPLSASHG